MHLRETSLIWFSFVPYILGSTFQSDPTFETIYSRPKDEVNLTDIHFAGFVPMTGDSWPGGYSQMPTIRWAMEDVGSVSNLLPGYRLVLSVANTGVGVIVCANDMSF